MNERCPMKGHRVARRAIAGDEILDDWGFPFPGHGYPKRSADWVPHRRPPGNGRGGGNGGGGGHGGGGGFDDDDDDDGDVGGGGGLGGGAHNGGYDGVSGLGDGRMDDDETRRLRQAGSMSKSNRPKTKTNRNRNDNGNGAPSKEKDKRKVARPGSFGRRSTPESPLSRKRRRHSEVDEGEVDHQRRRLAPSVDRLDDLFRDDPLDLTLGDLENGRRADIVRFIK